MYGRPFRYGGAGRVRWCTKEERLTLVWNEEPMSQKRDMGSECLAERRFLVLAWRA